MKTCIFALLLVFIFVIDVNASQVPICKGIKYSGIMQDNSSKVIYTYDYNLDISVNHTNTPYVNTVVVSNYTFWSINSTIYWQYPVLWFHWVPTDHEVMCSLENSTTCTFSFPNGGTYPGFWFVYGSGGKPQFVLDDKISFFFNEGTIFIDGSGWFFDNDNDFCFDATAWFVGFISVNQSACCSNVEYITVPDSNDNYCEHFETNATIIDSSNNVTIEFNTQYNIFQNYLNMSVKMLKNKPTNYSVTIGALDRSSCGYSYTPSQYTCYKDLQNEKNVQLEFFFNTSPFEFPSLQRPTYQIIMGELIIRNGTFLKDNNVSYTPNDRCWNKSMVVPYTRATTYQSTFCCTKFKNDGVSSTSSSTAMTTTSTPLNDERLNAIGTPCSNDTSKAWLDIVFVIDVSNAMSQRDLNILSGQVATFLHPFTFGQNENHTIRAAIVSYATQVTINFQLNETTTYADFVNELFLFAQEANLDDEGGNVQEALQSAFTLLQNQDSYRVPIIFLIAAAYSDTGYQGAKQTAKIIKDNGINIIVINFAIPEGVMTNALQNISSLGYYYISTQDGLYNNIAYALTQINCYCPSNTLQLKIYNTAWKNYTNYADCLYGVAGETYPSVANRVCSPGTLVALTSQIKLDFISDNILPYSLKNKKKFTIGLHKSDNMSWKWWGYNSTQYSLGNFPTFTQNPASDDAYSYMWNNQGFNWKLQTGGDDPLPYICQTQACDANYFCKK